MYPKTHRWYRFLDALSQLFNVLIFNGDSNHSVSGDAYYLRRFWLEKVIDRVASLFGDMDHCRMSHENDKAKARILASMPDGRVK